MQVLASGMRLRRPVIQLRMHIAIAIICILHAHAHLKHLSLNAHAGVRDPLAMGSIRTVYMLHRYLDLDLCMCTCVKIDIYQLLYTATLAFCPDVHSLAVCMYICRLCTEINNTLYTIYVIHIFKTDLILFFSRCFLFSTPIHQDESEEKNSCQRSSKIYCIHHSSAIAWKSLACARATNNLPQIKGS